MSSQSPEYDLPESLQAADKGEWFCGLQISSEVACSDALIASEGLHKIVACSGSDIRVSVECLTLPC